MTPQPMLRTGTARVKRSAREMANNGWSTRFAEAIVLDDGTTLTTLRDAVQYLARTVPNAEQNDEKAQRRRSPDQVRLPSVLRSRGDAAGDPPQQGARVQPRPQRP